MANVYAVKSGNWSDTTVWNTGALPTSADDVYSNTFTVTVDISPTVLSVRNTSGTGINAGGTFSFSSISNGVILTLINGTAPFTSAPIFVNMNAGQSATINGNLVGGGNTQGLTLQGSGTLFINGSIPSGGSGGWNGVAASGSANLTVLGNVASSGGTAIVWSSFGVLNITGTCSGGGGGSAVVNNTGATINITGACTSSGISTGVNNASTGTINITGTSTSSGSGTGVNNASTGTINITGTCTGGSSTGTAFTNSSTGTISHIGTAQASATAPAIGAGAVGQVTILTGPLLSTDASYTGAPSSGVNPCIALRWFPADTALSTFEYRMRGQTVAGSPSARPARQMFLTDAYNATYPTAANVRSGTAYGPSSIYTGTCAVPAAASVAFGVPVDNTTGTATLTAADVQAALTSQGLTTTRAGYLDRLPNTSTTQEVADIIDAAI